MAMFTKAQGMSLNTIVIAILVLIVLIILAVLFSSYFRGWSGKVSDCASQGGSCVASSSPLTDICSNEIGDITSKPLSGKCEAAGVERICCPAGTTKARAIIPT